MISTVLSIPNHWAWSQSLSMPNTGHNLNHSINAEHWAQSQLFYQWRTTGHDFREYYFQTLGTISNDLSMPNQWAWSQRLSMQNSGTISTILLMPNTGHYLKDYQCQTLGTISTILSMPNTGHYLRDYQCQTLGTISTNLSMPNAGHNINYSINAKRWARSQLFYQYQTTGHDLWDYQYQTLGTISPILSIPNTGHDLNWSINAKHWTWSLRLLIPNHWAQSQLFYQCQTNEHNLINLSAKRGTITSPKVIKRKSIPTNVYLDIYVTD